MNTVEIMRNTYGYMGYQMNRAEITTPNDPSLLWMVDNGLTPEDCTSEFDQRTQMFSVPPLTHQNLYTNDSSLLTRNLLHDPISYMRV